MKKILFSLVVLVALGLFMQHGNAIAFDNKELSLRVDSFLTAYNNEYRQLNIVSNEAQWKLLTHIVEGDTATSNEAQRSANDLAAFQGSASVIKLTQQFLGQKDKLQPLQVEQLQHILYFAGGSPQTVADVVKEKIKAETEASEKLYGFNYTIDGKSVTTNDIDGILITELDTNKRLKAWESSKEVGKILHAPLENLRELRNKTVQGLNYPDFFSYQVADYGMSADTMMTLLRGINDEIYPLYRELHTWARYELAKKYHSKTVPDFLPAQWLPNRWGQDWSDLVTVKGTDLDSIIHARKYDAEWVVQEAERYYVSMGFPSLPKTFWEKSSLYPVPPDAGYKKNNHASAWHMDYDQDVRSLMSVEPNAHWYETTHHEFGHIYYYLSYSRPGVPYILREGANRAFHEALGTMFGMAAMQQPFLAGLGLSDPKAKVDTIQSLMKEALRYIVALNWQAGTMSEFEYELYAKNMPADQFNKRWWEIVKREQGIVPPYTRDETYCDAATKTHIIDDPGQYYDYALSTVLQFQFHCYIAKNILHQNPAFTNYYGNKEIGNFIGGMMSVGGIGDWRTLLREKTGSDLTAKPMLDYFAPLMAYLKKANKGRKYTLPEKRKH
ncbi:MAG: M2 family metallopeptidase [Bacteroidetes bacterium]|nr:M2 family metallopeptidase [Bacteroidota bacterium]